MNIEKPSLKNSQSKCALVKDGERRPKLDGKKYVF